MKSVTSYSMNCVHLFTTTVIMLVRKTENTDPIIFSLWYILECLHYLIQSAQSNYCKQDNYINSDVSGTRISLINAQHFKDCID